MELSYLSLVVISLLLGLGTQWYINHTFKRWSRVPVDSRESGAQVARRFLDSEGLRRVEIHPNGGSDLSDYYDPRSDALYLSGSSKGGASVASIAVACHEAGHAVQHARNYGPARARMALVPAVNIGSQLWMVVLILGVFIQATSLVWIGIALFAFVVVFQLVTLPVEFDASARAMRFIEADGSLSVEQARGARQMLTAAALTYVASALTSILQLVYLLQQNQHNEE